MDICGLGAKRHEGLSFAHGLPELASCSGFGGLAEFEIPDCFGERPGQTFAMRCSPSELVDGSWLGGHIQGCVQCSGRAADPDFVLLSRLNSLGQHVLRNLDSSLTELEDRSQFETER